MIFASDPKQFQKAQSLKGIFFISVSSIFLFLIINRYYGHISRGLIKTQKLLTRYQALGDASREGIIDHDLRSDKAYINEQMKVYFQVGENILEHYSIKLRKKIHPDDREYILDHFEHALSSGASLWQGDYRCLLTDGTYHDVTHKGSILRDENGMPERFISVLQDVTEIRNMKTAFYQQQMQHRQLLGQSIIQAQENERNRWAEELHDNIGQLLTVVKLYLDQLATRPDNAPALVNKIREMTIRALNDIRQLSASVKPPEFNIYTLEQSIRALLDNIRRVKHFEFNLDFSKLEIDQLSDDQKLMIYRVVQEQLNNIIKYAEADFISIEAYTEDRNVKIQVSDNGKGFNTAATVKGIGLRNIRSRLQVYSGSLEIDSQPGRGCTLNAVFSIVGIAEEDPEKLA
ncbi:MAG: PAS domain-containing protein [Flavisolibacter sp.]|jgi:two-component system sensor histidine kinase UhpB|nr:PAS domain-containing protein [Flavisolibacter sp.]